MADKEYSKKVLIIGDAAVGKTSLVRRITEGRFLGEYIRDTVGTNCVTKVMKREDVQVRVSLWDIAGQDRFRSLMRTFARGASGVIIMCDVTREVTLAGAKLWKQSVDEQLYPCPPTLLLVNKFDSDKKLHQITAEQVEEFAQTQKIEGWYQTSVKENRNIQESLEGLVDLMLKIPEDSNSTEEALSLSYLYPGHKRKSCCGK